MGDSGCHGHTRIGNDCLTVQSGMHCPHMIRKALTAPQRGHQSLQLSTTPYLLFMPHCPRPLYEAILIENWNSLQRPGSRWVLLGNDLIDYVPHAASAHVRASDKSADGMVVVKSRRKRRVRSGALKCLPGNSALERLGEYCNAGALLLTSLSTSSH